MLSTTVSNILPDSFPESYSQELKDCSYKQRTILEEARQQQRPLLLVPLIHCKCISQYTRPHERANYF